MYNYKKNLENPNGITLISLVATIIIMLLLATAGITGGLELYEHYKMKEELTRMTLIQVKVKNIGEEHSFDSSIRYYGIKYSELGNKSEIEDLSLGIDLSDYYYLNEDALKQLKLKSINQFSHKDYLVNYETGNVISIQGFKLDGKEYHVLTDVINDGLLKEGSLEID